MSFLSLYPDITPEELFCEDTMWLRYLDSCLLPSEQKEIIRIVKKELGIDHIIANLKDFNFENIKHIKKGSQVIEKLGIYLGKSLSFICPPVTNCIFCDKLLTKNNACSQVVVHHVNGPKMFSKYIYRCRNCKMSKTKESALQPQDVYYHPDKVIKIIRQAELSRATL